jgi:hypothetical protein
LAFSKDGRETALELRFRGANPGAKLEARREGAARVNYLSGSQRRAGLPTYGELVYRELWPGVDMVFRGAGGKLEYEFFLRPGADPADIRRAPLVSSAK